MIECDKCGSKTINFRTAERFRGLFVCAACGDKVWKLIKNYYDAEIARVVGNYLYKTLEIEYAEQHVRCAMLLEVEERYE